MPTTKPKTMESKPAVIDEEQSDSVVISIESVVLAGLSSERSFDTQVRDDTGNATMGLRVDDIDGNQTFRTTICSVSLNDSDERLLVNVESKFRIEFEIDGEVGADGAADELSALALRVSYPYHRQIISSVVAQSGLPGVTLPLIPDPQLEKIATRRQD